MPTVDKVARTDAGLAAELRFGVMRLRRRLAAERHPDNELSLGSMAVLAALHGAGTDELTVGELAIRERVKAPSMTRTVGALVDGGYVARRPHDTDGRAVVLNLTEKGRTTLLADRARRDEWLAARLRSLTPDERALLRSATPILHRLAQED